MLDPNQLQIGDVILWNPQLTHPQTTITATPIVIESIQGESIGYAALGVEHRAEPFEDDVVNNQPRTVPLNECEAIKLSDEVLSKLEFTKDANGSFVYNHDKTITVSNGQVGILNGNDLNPEVQRLEFLHQLQQILRVRTGSELYVVIE